MVDATNNACERALRPAVIQRKVTNGYRALWAAKGGADIGRVVDTARLGSGTNAVKTILQTVSARTSIRKGAWTITQKLKDLSSYHKILSSFHKSDERGLYIVQSNAGAFEYHRVQAFEPKV
ncbi:hypothetical protein BB934_02980 [Microvirga ossetica]|uniref:Transposase n=1 Tax=Microvirga ossetica TaxID=1882682 RepID=A0A1B2EBF8_9HYPH|nr:hypothetical protein BB934_02980 [Microvirga ossetica]